MLSPPETTLFTYTTLFRSCPIPVIHCPKCDVVPVPDDQLPVTLPEDVSFDRPGNALDHHLTWKHVNCPKCGGKEVHFGDRKSTRLNSSHVEISYDVFCLKN